MNDHPLHRWLDGATLLLGLLLLWVFVRQTDFHADLDLLVRIGPLPFLIYLTVNGALAILFASRWWLLLRGMGLSLPFGRVAVYRLIAATISLLTPGPQFGGEPAQVYLLVRRSRLAAPRAVASVALDRLLELTLNFMFLAGGILYALRNGILGTALDGRMILLTLFSLALLFFLWGRGLSLAAGLETLFGWLPRAWRPPALLRLVRSLRDGEVHLHGILRQHPRLIVTGLLVSAGQWCLLLADFWLATRLVGMELTLDQWIGFVVAARIAILLPIPAGVGALAASQIMAAQRLGLNPALALGLVLLFRVRDIALALWGLWLARREMNAHARPPFMPLGALTNEDKYGL